MVATLNLGAALIPKLTLAAGPDHEGAYQEPNEVTIVVKFHDGTTEQFKLSGGTVILDPENAGIYRANTVASVLGTVHIVATAEWTADEFDLVIKFKVEIVDPFAVL